MIRTALKRLAICCSAVTLLILCSASPARVGELRTDRYVYTGGIDHGKQHGFGICRYTNGNVYSGHWNHAYKEGLGLMEFADGTMEFGRWRRGTLQRKSGTNFNVGQTVYGLDVSKYQKNIKWKQLALPASARGKLTKTGTYLQPVLFMVVKSTRTPVSRRSRPRNNTWSLSFPVAIGQRPQPGTLLHSEYTIGKR